jgi:hypothetical protein
MGTVLLLTAFIIRPTVLANHAPRYDKLKIRANKPVLKSVSHFSRTRVPSSAFRSLPLSFEPNVGQAGDSVKYLSHGRGYAFFLTQTGATITLQRPVGDSQFFQKLDNKQQKKFETRKFGRALTRLRKRQQQNRRAVQMGIYGANPAAQIEALDELPGKSNYFIGTNARKWRTGIPNFVRIRYKEIYPGVDLIYYGNQGRLEFDFVVSPGADPKNIGLKFGDNEHVTIASDGSLQLSRKEVLLPRPTLYQIEKGRKQLVDGRFALLAGGLVGIRVGPYDRTKPLIVDPVLVYSSYVGVNNDDADADAIAVDSLGDTYVAGSTPSLNFPIVNGFQTTGNSNYVAFVAEFSPSGSTLLYSTYLGGTGGDYSTGISVGQDQSVYVTGYSFSTDFPVVNGLQRSNDNATGGNAFISRIDATQAGAASLVYSSYLGGGGNPNNPNPWLGDMAIGIAADSSGRAYITGSTTSDASVSPFPTTASAYQSSLSSPNGNAFLTVVDTTQAGAASLVYSTYLGGDGAGAFGDIGTAIAVDPNGHAYVLGQTTSDATGPFPTTPTAYQSTLKSPNGNIFLAEIDTTQSGSASLVYSTYFGGSTTNPLGDYGGAITLDSVGKVYLAGDAESSDFPTTPGAFQSANSANGKGIIAKFDVAQSGAQSLVYSTFLGGMNSTEGDGASGVAVDANGNAFVAGFTSSTDFPVTSDAFQSALKSNGGNAFLTELNPNGTAELYSTYLGGSSSFGDVAVGISLDPVGNPYIAGYTESTDFPTTAGALQGAITPNAQSGFIAKFALNPNPLITSSILPTPNSSGWNNTPATVMFSCTPGADPIQDCASPLMVRAEGANQPETGTVQDTAGNTATTTATVNLDMTAPIITITSPSNGASVSIGSLTVTGTITDTLSGPGSVTCHGAPATLSGSSFSCNVQLAAGSNSIAVIGTDLAGNTSAASISVTNTGASGQSNPPTISGILPNQGGIGSAVSSITGSAFGATQGSSTVMFNGIPAPILSWSDSNISASVPVGLNPGLATVKVAVNGSASNGVQFTVTAPLFITPNQITMLVGNTQPIQLVDENGVALIGATWRLDSASIAQVVPPENGQPTLLKADAVGITILIGNYGNRTGTATVTVLPAGSALPTGAVLWSAPSLGPYGMSKIVDAVPGAGTPTLYAEDDGAYQGNGAIRAFDGNGQQVWIWPASSTDKFPFLLGGDNQGGAIYFANQDTPNQFQSYCYFGRVDQNGNETWQYQESNCDEDSAVGPDGTIYLLEDEFQNSGTNVVTALDPATGQIKFTVPLPGFDSFSGGADYTMMPPPGDPNGVQQPYCTPGTSVPAGNPSTNAQPFEHGNMSVAADGTVYIPLTGGTTFFDGEPCNATPDPNNPGYTTVVNFVNRSQGSFTDSRTLYLMAMKPDGSYTIQTVDSQNLSGPGWFGSPQYEVFMQRPVPNGQGSVLLPIEQTLYNTSASGGNISLPFPVPPGNDLVLGSDGTAYVREWDPNGSGYRNIVTAVNTNGGGVNWTYQASQGNLSIASVLSSGGVAVSNDRQGLSLLDPSGGASAPVVGFGFLGSSWEGQWYALGAPGSAGGVSALALPAVVDEASTWATPEGNPMGAETEAALCGCEVQSDSSAPTPPTPQNCPICYLPPPSPPTTPTSCTVEAGSGPVYLILAGDPGLNTVVNGRLRSHNAGNLFNLAAQTQTDTLNSQGNAVIACRVSSVQDVEAAMTRNGLINGGVIYFGHGGGVTYSGDSNKYSALLVGQAKGFYTNITAKNVNLLSNAKLGSNITITLNGCNTGSRMPDGNPPIAQVLAKQLQIAATGYDAYMHFSNDDGDNDKTVAGSGNPYGLPMYMNPDGKPPRKLPIAFYPPK